MRIQILLFLKLKSDSEVPPNPGSSEDHPVSKGYALIQSKWQNHYPLKFLENTVPVVSHNEVNPSPNDKFAMIEVWEDDKFCTTSQYNVFKRWDRRLYIEQFNVDTVRGLFHKTSTVDFVTGFRHNAIESALDEENLKTIEKLLLSGANISYRHPEGGTLAHFAAEKASGPMIKLLHKCRADLNVRRKDSAMPLHIAVKNGYLETVKTLLENGANIDDKMNGGFSPLHLATKAAFSNIVEFLLKEHAHVNAKTNDGWTSLHFAADMGNMELCTLLLRHRAGLNSKIEKGTDVTGATPLHVALKKKRSEVARKLIDSGASLNAQCHKGRNALNFAVASNDLEIVEQILNRQPNVNKPGNKKAFRVAFGRNGCHHKKMIERMMEYGFTLEARDATVPDIFFGAIHKNLYTLVQKLLEYGANVHQYAYFLHIKTRPISVACQYAEKDMVQLLLDHGADPLVPRGAGRDKTPIADAVEFGKLEVLKLLLENKISICDRPDLLLKAVTKGHWKKIELLLENGADPNRRADIGRLYGTPMSVALSKGYVEAVEVLMRFGARFDFRDIDGTEAGTSNCLQAFLDFGFVDLDSRGEAWLRRMLREYDADYRSYHDLERLKKCAKALAQHLIKLQVTGKTVGEADDVIPQDCFRTFRLNDFQSWCEKEIANLKIRKISDTEITFFDVLVRSAHQIARYARNDSILQILTNFDFKSEFPNFGSIIECKVRQGNWRRELIDKAVKIFSFLTSRFIDNDLPFEVMEIIISFLSNQDIIILQKCFVKK